MNSFLESVKELLEYTFLKIPVWRLALAVVVIILALAVRKLFVNVVLGFLKKLTAKTKTKWDDHLINAINPPARLIIITFGIMIAANVLQFDVQKSSFLNHFIRTLIIISILWAFYRAADIIANILEGIVKKTETTLDDLLLPFASKGLKVIIIVVGVSVIAKEWDYDIGTLLAGLGLGGLAFALAAKDTLSNLFGGLTIMLDRPFMAGDWIMTPIVEGTIEEIGFRSTKVRTFAQALVTIPNAKLADQPITNWSKMGKRRVKFNIGVTYDTNYVQMENVLQNLRDMLKNHPAIHPDTIFVYFDSFGDSSLEIFLYFFTKTTVWQEFLEAKEDINLRIMKILEESGVEVAFPSTSVYIEKMADERVISS